MKSNISVPLILGILGTIGFNLSPIIFGSGVTMNICFMLYAGSMFLLSLADRRVLGYATVLSVCNPANWQVYMSYSFLLAGMTVFKDFMGLGQVMRELNKRGWWWLLMAAFFFVVLSVPFWPSDMRAMMTEVKQALGHLGFLLALPLAVGLTIRTPQDGIRAVSWLCMMSVALFVIFSLQGTVSMVAGSNEVERFIGYISLSFMRTSICIPLAALAASGLALGVSNGLTHRAVPYYLIMGVSFLMIMQLASVGSAFAMICGMGVVALAYLGVRLSLGRILFGVVLFSVVGSGLYWAVFNTENFLSKRIEEKEMQFNKIGIDRMELWEEGIAEIRDNPFGKGWSTSVGHSDWLLFTLSYGWASGLFYITAAGSLFLSMWRSLRKYRTADGRPSATLLMVGLAALTVYIINSVLDMLSANVGYYETVWTLILTSATVVAVTEAAVLAEKSSKAAVANGTVRAENMTNFALPPASFRRQYRRP
jgi:hypothetical protein